jgi:hypothetical protein
MEAADIRRAVWWAVGAFIATEVHPVSAGWGLLITAIAAVIGAIS